MAFVLFVLMRKSAVYLCSCENDPAERRESWYYGGRWGTVEMGSLSKGER